MGLGFIVSSFFSCRFTKNLSPDKINLSTLKGQGQLTNLELDEEVLQNVLELPTWLAITRVYCNKASIRVSGAAVPAAPGAAAPSLGSCFVTRAFLMENEVRFSPRVSGAALEVWVGAAASPAAALAQRPALLWPAD